jgi:hypothetical protein
VYGFNVLEQDVFDVIGDIGRISQRANTHGTAFVACNILDVYVGTVTFDGYAVLEKAQLVRELDMNDTGSLHRHL